MAEISTLYAESVALTGMSPEAEREFSIRLSRFPSRGEGTLWLSAFVGRKALGAAIESLDLGERAGATALDDEPVAFEVSGAATVRFESRERGSRGLVGRVVARAGLHESAHPELGAGPVEVSIEAEFHGSHEAVRVRPGRLEVMGRVRARLVTPSGEHTLEVPGKWHEQTGERPSFAPAFSYFAVQGGDVALLASVGTQGSWGFALLEGKTVRVTGFRIEPHGPPIRAFRADLLDGRTIEGEAIVKREASVPIEGQRRPGATVLAPTNLGDLVGHLNDWQPDD